MKVILVVILVIDGQVISCEIALRQLSLNLSDDKWALDQVMACRQEDFLQYADPT